MVLAVAIAAGERRDGGTRYRLPFNYNLIAILLLVLFIVIIFCGLVPW